ncbi:MAG: DUF6391 domain-containing protein [Chloroflexi bacterium]|nr:DUF6391 domain-containing protein [Chloroflexota bacterium]
MRILDLANVILRWGPVRATRRNHALEHATVHVLQERYPELRVSGYSTPQGFALIGNLPEQATEQAVHEALKRLREGQHQLALHPQCGTNLAVQVLLCTLIGLLGFSGVGWRRALNRVNPVSMLVLLTTLFAPILGMYTQKHLTTNGDVGSLEVHSAFQQKWKLPLVGTIAIQIVRTKYG